VIIGQSVHAGRKYDQSGLGRYQIALDRNKYRHVVLSCDPAGKAGTRNDYTAIAISGVRDKELHLLYVTRTRPIDRRNCVLSVFSLRWQIPKQMRL